MSERLLMQKHICRSIYNKEYVSTQKNIIQKKKRFTKLPNINKSSMTTNKIFTKQLPILKQQTIPTEKTSVSITSTKHIHDKIKISREEKNEKRTPGLRHACHSERRSRHQNEKRRRRRSSSSRTSPHRPCPASSTSPTTTPPLRPNPSTSRRGTSTTTAQRTLQQNKKLVESMRKRNLQYDSGEAAAVGVMS